MRALAATLITFGSLAGGANGAVTINIFNDGTNVTISSAGGTVDLTGMSIINFGIGFSNSLHCGNFGLVGVEGSDSGDSTEVGSLAYFNGFSLGNGSRAPGTFTRGDQTIAIREVNGLGGGNDILFFPSGWTGGVNTLNAFSFTTESTNITTLGYISGSSAVWTATSGDTVTIQISPPIPEPSSVLLLGFGTMGLLSRRRRIK